MGIDIAAERERAAKQQVKEERDAAYRAEQAAIDKKIMARSKWICAVCGSPGDPKTYTKGSFIIELILWVGGLLCLLTLILWPAIFVPIIYSIWRLASRSKGCRSCRGVVVKTDTPVGKDLLKKALASS